MMKRKIENKVMALVMLGSMIFGVFLTYRLPLFTAIADSGNPLLFLVSLWLALATGGTLMMVLASFIIAFMTGQLKDFAALFKSIFH